jgi:hypothetical protein
MRGGHKAGMGIPVSILLVTAGAILAFAVDATTSGVNIHAVGWILMAAGIVGLVLSLIMWDSWAGGGYWGRRRSVAYDVPARSPRRTVVREDVDEY